jgi:hypothetical protein
MRSIYTNGRGALLGRQVARVMLEHSRAVVLRNKLSSQLATLEFVSLQAVGHAQAW